MRSRGVGAAALAALVLAPAAAAGPGEDARTAVRAVDRAVASGKIDEDEAELLRIAVRRARAELVLLPGSRGAELASVLRQVASHAREAGPARLRALVATLDQNGSYLGVNPVPAPRAYVRDADGLVYRAFPGVGLQFHPLATFGRLNSLVTRGDQLAVARLAARILDVGARRGGSLVWSYEFAFGGGRPPWTSGMAQAVAAQALARAGTRFGTPALVDAARRAYREIPAKLLGRLSAGPWIRLYSFTDLVVLNAQLQAALSLAEYGRLAGDAQAASLAVELRRAAAELLPRFDTGHWSRYTLVGESSLGYHLYVVSLLEALARRTALPFWHEAAARFGRYTDEAPKLRSRSPTAVLYPRPADGWRDVAAVRFWLSKSSEVTVRIGPERRRLSLGQGTHSLRWAPPGGRPGTYPARIAAVDLAGNRSVLRLPDLRVRIDRTAPRVAASLRGRRLTWAVVDRGTPTVRVTLRLVDGERTRVRKLGAQRLRGALRVRLARGEWRAVLDVTDVSGNRARVRLGAVSR